MVKKVICISGKARSGKDTSAQFLRDQLENLGNRVLLFHMSDLLKFQCEKYFEWDGKKDDKGRTLLQNVGTDKVRKRNPDYWVNYAIDFFNMWEDEFDYIIIPDVRFPNELTRLKEAGYNVVTIRIVAPETEESLTGSQSTHSSETSLDSFEMEHFIFNDKLSKSGIDDLRDNLSSFVEIYLYPLMD